MSCLYTEVSSFQGCPYIEGFHCILITQALKKYYIAHLYTTLIGCGSATVTVRSGRRIVPSVSSIGPPRTADSTVHQHPARTSLLRRQLPGTSAGGRQRTWRSRCSSAGPAGTVAAWGTGTVGPF